MMRTFISTLLLIVVTNCSAQLYFPPTTGTTWETVSPDSLGWCTDQLPPLLTFLEDNGTKAFIVLKDGRIAIEQYFGTFTGDSLWYWASAGKSLTAFLIGMAQADGLLDIDEPSSTYLGPGWTSCTPAQELAITVRHQLTMTTGLDDGVPNVDCTDPACLQYLADPGTRWSYHNAPYTLLDQVITGATGGTLNNFLQANLTFQTGISGLFIPLDYNNVFFSKPRSMARFGLLALNNGNWNGTSILGDQDYFTAMTTQSQTLNNSYGYLWWLNGQSSYMVPGLQLQLPGTLLPNEPADAFNALGKNGQFVNVVPSQGIVLVRMGNAPDATPVPYLFNDNIWEYLNAVICTSTSLSDINIGSDQPLFHPVPATDHILLNTAAKSVLAIDHLGRTIALQVQGNQVSTEQLATGVYIIRCADPIGIIRQERLIIQR